MAGMVLRVLASAAIGDDHGAVVPVDPEARRGTAGRHDDEHRDLQLHGMVSHGHGEVTVSGHDHALPLLLLGAKDRALEVELSFIPQQEDGNVVSLSCPLRETS